MSGSYINNKKSIYNYRAKNLERWNELSKISKRKMRLWKKIQIEFFNILLS
jgi:hypothetical protein